MDPGLSLDNLEAHVADVENFLKEEKERFSTGSRGMKFPGTPRRGSSSTDAQSNNQRTSKSMIEAPLDFSSNQSKLLGVNHTDPFANNNSIFDSSSITVGDGSKQISNSVSNSGGSGEGKLDREKLVAFLVQRAQNRNNPITNSMHPNTNINIQTNPGLSTGGDPFVSSSAVDASSQSIPAFDAKYAASYTNNIINGSINIGGGSGGNGMRAGTSANADASSRNTNSGMSAGDRHALVNRLLEERRLATLGGNAQSQQIQPPSGSASSIGDGSSSTNSMNTTPTQMSGAQTLFHAADLSPFQSSMGHLNNKDQLVSPSPLPQRQSSVAAAAEQEKALKDAIFKHTMQQLNNSTGKTQRQVPLATSSMSTSSLAAVAAAARGEGDDNEDIPTSTNYNMTSVDALIHDMSQDNIKKNTRKARKKSAKSSQRAGAQPPAKRNTYVTNTDKMKGNKKKTSSRKDDKYSSNSKNSKRRLKEKGGGSNTLYHAADLESQLISSSSIPSSPKKSMNGHSTHNNDYPTSPYKNQQNLTVTQPFNLTNMVYNRNSKEHVYRALEKELAAQCTFTPTINPSPAQIYSQHNQHQYHKRVERDRRNTNNGSDYDGSGAGDDSAFTDHQRSDGSFTSHSSGWMGSSSNINNANISMHGQDRVSGSMTDSTMTDKGDGPRQHLNYTYNNGNGGGDKESSRERDLNQLSLNVSATYNRSMGGDNMRGRLKEWDRMSRQKRKEKEMRAKEREQELYRECTFKPNINKQRRKRRDSNEYDGAYMAASNNSRTGKVSKKKSQKKKKASKKGGRKGPDVGDYYDKHDGNHHDQQLTAHKSSQSRKEKVNVQAVCDRLHAGGKARAIMREKARRQREEEKLKDYTFKPKVNANSQRKAAKVMGSSVHHKTHTRLTQMEKEKQGKIERLRIAKAQEDPDLTFKPTISTGSEKLVKRMGKRRASMGMHGDMHGDESGAYHADVVTRLYQNHSVSIETKLRRQSEHRDEFYNQYQFQPDISQKSRRLVERSNRFKGSKRDFLTRQNAYQQERQKSETYDRVHHVSEAERQCSFRPNIGNADEVLKNSRHRYTYMDETEEEKFVRLSRKDAQEREKARQRIKKEYHEDLGLTFKPKIDARSAIIGRDHSIHELSDPYNKGVERAKAKVAAEEKKAATFTPHVCQSSRRIAAVLDSEGSRYKLDGQDAPFLTRNINKDDRYKKKKITKAKKEIQYREIKECTFRPKINKTHPSQPTGPVLVRGMARFLEMKELGRQKVQEQKEREDQVFWKDRSLLNQSSGAQNKSYTKPEPFNLSCFQQSPGEKSRAKKALIEKVRAEIDRECTFQPKTWRRQQKNLINQILADEDEEVGGGKNRGYNYDGNADMDNSVGYSGVNHDNNNSMLNGSRKGTGAVNGNEDDMDPFAANDASLNDESVMNVNLDTFDDLMIDDFDEAELNDTNFDAHFSALTQGTNTNEADMSTNTTALNAHTGVGAGVNTSNMEAFLDDFEQMGLDEFGIPTLGTQ